MCAPDFTLTQENKTYEYKKKEEQKKENANKNSMLEVIQSANKTERSQGRCQREWKRGRELKENHTIKRKVPKNQNKKKEMKNK